jgi:hypothetical protein
LGLLCLTSLSTIFQLYHGGQWVEKYYNPMVAEGEPVSPITET